MSRWPSMRAALATFAFVLALVGQASALVHMKVTAHKICAEHGKLVDEDAGADDHCALGLSPADTSWRVDPATAPFTPIAPFQAPRFVSAPVLTADVLLVAPKTSPPA
jgi:hypothetical protein